MKTAQSQKGSLRVIVASKKVKIASFDMDDTLIATKTGMKFARDEFDWKWKYASIPDILRKMYRNKYIICVFTNQGKKDKKGCKETHADIISRKIDAIIADLGIPVQFYMATGKDTFRKPCNGMWMEMLNRNGLTADQISTKYSFYCGDAAGRKGDFSDSDRAFASNVPGLAFRTPEMCFEKAADEPFVWTMLTAEKLLADEESRSAYTVHMPPVLSDSCELVLLVGLPASGKSCYYARYFKDAGYVYVNRDTLGTMPKCVKLCKTSLEAGASVVIDNTNVTVKHRKQFIDEAKRLGIPCRCVVFKTSGALTQYLNMYRRLATGKSIPTVVYRNMNKAYEIPDISEGFSEITEGVLEFDETLVDTSLFYQRASIMKREIWY